MNMRARLKITVLVLVGFAGFQPRPLVAESNTAEQSGQEARVFTLAPTPFAVAQNSSTYESTGPALGSARLTSSADRLVTIKSIGILSFSDNAKGIYAPKIHEDLASDLEKRHRWVAVSIESNSPPSLAELETNSNLRQKVLSEIAADAVVAGHLVEQEKGFEIQMGLFLKADQRLLAEERLIVGPSDLNALKKHARTALQRLLDRIPYDGEVMSRENETVTVNVGRRDGVRVGQRLSAIQIISLERHPARDFLVRSDRDVIAGITLTRVDETISFGQITSESAPQVVQPRTKVMGVKGASYGEPTLPGRTAGQPSVGGSLDGAPREWLPEDQPTFGLVGASVGLGALRHKMQLNQGGALESGSTLHPQVRLRGELWLTPTFILRTDLQQGIASIDNPLAGSSPSDLSFGFTRTSFTIGYRHNMQRSFFGPSVFGAVGLDQFKTTVDSTTPRAFTSLRYSSYVFQLGGQFPLMDDSAWRIHGLLNLHLRNKLSEAPETSGSSSENSWTDFNLGASYVMTPRLWLTGGLEVLLLSTQFAGSGTRTDSAESASLQNTTLHFGVDYLF